MSARLFYLLRTEDVHGQSGTGVVAEGVAFSDGTGVLNWLVEPTSVVLRADWRDFIKVHGHGGRTQLKWGTPRGGGQRSAGRRRKAQGGTDGATGTA